MSEGDRAAISQAVQSEVTGSLQNFLTNLVSTMNLQQNNQLAQQQTAFMDAIKHMNGDQAQREGKKENSGDLSSKLRKCMDSFKGTNFQDWKFKYLTILQTVAPDMKQYLIEVGRKDVSVDPELDTDPGYSGTEQFKFKAIYANLVEKTEGEAFYIVRGIPDENGAEAWRKLCQRYDSRTIGKTDTTYP